MSYRKIVVDGEEWEWTAGVGSVQVRRQDKTKSYVISKQELTSNFYDDQEDITITPRDVADYIKRKSCPICRGNIRMHRKSDGSTQKNLATCPKCKGKALDASNSVVIE